MHMSGRKHCVISSKATLNWGTGGWNQGYVNSQNASMICIHMCGGSGIAPNNGAGVFYGVEHGNTDLERISQMNASSDEKTERLYIRNWNLDFTVTNSNVYPMEYDVYEIRYKLNTYTKGVGSFTDLSVNADQYCAKDDQATTKAIFVNTFGFGYRYMDPIAFAALAKVGVIVTKRTKYLLQAQETFTYQSKGYGGSYTHSENDSGYINGMTRTFMIISKSVVGYNEEGSCLTTVGVSRYYNYYNLAPNQRLNASSLTLTS